MNKKQSNKMREMKDSGIFWVGEIPKEWLCIKAKNIIKSNDGGVWGNEPTSTENDKIVLRSTEQTIDGKWIIEEPAKRDLSKIPYKNCLIKPNDLLITKSSGSSLHIGKTTLADDYFTTNECYYSNFLQRIRLQKSYYPLYAWFIFNAVFVREQFAYMQNSTSGLGNINSTDIENIIVPIPTLAEQQRIAEFLDRECGKIDGLKADIQAQIDTLEQYKRSVITEAVTHGLNPSAPMKDSGIPWVGQFPTHWTKKKGKYILRYMSKPVKQDDGVITCFRDGEVTLRSNRREDGFTMADKEIGYQGVDVGDLVVHGMDGFAGAIGISDSRGKASPVLNVLNTKQNKKYIMYYLRSMAYGEVFTALSTGIRVRSCDLRWNKLAELLYPLPPIDEQNNIVNYIDEQIARTNEIIADKKLQIETLDGYKKSLIYEYVTGKKEVV